MKNKLIVLLIGIAVLFAACNAGKDFTGYEYMPDMKHSRAYEIYTPNPVFNNGISAQLPAEGAVARGFMPYNLPNTNDGYETAGRTIKSPFNNIEHKNAIANGKELYTIYCAVCHGTGGKADGTIVKNGKYPPPPSYFRDDILKLAEGKMFHSITHGKNLMGGYYSQVNQTERWQIISFIKDLQAKHIAKTDKISEEAALRRIFKGKGYISEAEFAKQNQTKSAFDKEYADLMPNIEKLAADYNFKFRFNKHGKGADDGHGHGNDGHGHGNYGNGHENDRHGHGNDHHGNVNHDHSNDKHHRNHNDNHNKKGHH